MNTTDYLVMAAALTAALLMVLFLWRKNAGGGGLHEADEKTKQLLRLYLLRIIAIILGAGAVGLAVLTFMQRETVPVDILWIYLLVLLMALAAGGWLAKRQS
ncbi:hypothetical protein DNH61_01530 [Paenibacillus sambharensis]|uniref:Uncharacterized protein n=1 Tax=Paenibacillus sambharensis TaxID=1803190 RepID=A0A2W1LHU3_9BACL|nr:hypothetical protein [Paenibacillus sambharensis]PZD97580.1 hypothetical protein DNH61_01530 [Paenibacillus sambharensis]